MPLGCDDELEVARLGTFGWRGTANALRQNEAHAQQRSGQAVRDNGMKPVIGSKPERPRKLPKSRALYAKRYLERFFHQPKRFRAIATRVEKTAQNCLALTVACAWLWLADTKDTPLVLD